jgi:hypothetical protein
MRAPKESVKLDELRIDANDFRLTDAGGKPFGNYPYFIISIERSSKRADWMLIPDIKATWDAIRQAFIAAQFNDAGNLLNQFERHCQVSPDLVRVDAQRLIKKARDTFGSQQSQTFGTQTTPKLLPFPEFHELDLYG